MQIQNFYNIGSVINMIILMATTLGGLYTFKKAVVRATAEIQKETREAQSHAISAMREEIDSLKGKLDNLRGENKRLEVILQTICAALKIQGTLITVEGEMVIIKDSSGAKTATRIQESEV